jgi:deazaflavin-dependent oxidoreductase (nitroreductase family)
MPNPTPLDAPAAGPGGVEPLTRPSLLARVGVRPMTRILNPLVRRMAGRRHVGWAAQVRHKGRRSGSAYVTPVGARLNGDVFWIPLTFGTSSDWCRNVRARGSCTIRWKGHDYRAVHPVVIDRAAAMSAARGAFKPPERAFMRVLGITHFLRLDLAQ